MRILHTESSPNFGGQELQIIEEMQWFRQRGHDVWLAAREGSGIHKLALERKLSVIPTGFRGAINLGVIASLWRECRRLEIELIVAHGSRDTTCAWPVARLLGLPLIRYQHICKRLKDGVFDKLLWRRANDQIVVVSGSIKNRLLEQQLAPAEKIQIIGGYVNRTEFHPQISPKDVRAKHQIPADATLITIVGMFRRDKGQHLLVEASTEILRQHPNC
jgi:glycosyltransferase involved in cell wall biosynthesis